MEKEKKPIYKKWWFWVIVVVVVLAIAGSSGNGDNANESKTTLTSGSETNSVVDSSANESTAKNQKSQYSVGEVYEGSSVAINFMSADDYTNYNSYSAPASGNKIIRAEFSFENVSSSDVSLGNIECYADGEKCEAYYYADDYKSPALESLSSGKKLKAVVYYEVPTNAESIALEYETNVWTSERVEFIVK